MKKIILTAFILCTVIIFVLVCARAQGEPSKLFLMDYAQNKVSEIPVKYARPSEIMWSPDSTCFVLVEEKHGWNGELKKEKLRLFESATLNEKTLPREINDSYYAYRSAYWADNDNLFLIETDDNDKKADRFRIYNVKTGRISTVASQDEEIYLADSSAREEAFFGRYHISGAESQSLINKIGQNYIIGILSSKKDRFLYSNRAFETYLFDMNTGSDKRLFEGFQVDWSPNETKVIYKLHKTLVLKEEMLDRNYPGEEFATFLYDIEKSKSVKIADFYADCYFSPNDGFIIFSKSDYFGHGEL